MMTLEELDRQLLSDEENLVSSLEEYKNAKVSLRKARITSITNKLLAPYKRFQINLAIAKYDAMMERLEKRREKEVRRAEKLQEKEQKVERKQAQADFKVALRDKRKEDIVNFINDKKEKVDNTLLVASGLGNSVISNASSFVVSVKNSAIKKVKENTTIDLIIKNAIEDVKLKYATDKYNKALDKKVKEEEKIRLQKLDEAINFDEDIREDFKNRDIPFANIKEKINKVSKEKGYIGKATNRVVNYYKNKKENIENKILDVKIDAALKTYETIGKVSMAKSKMITTFNNKLSEAKTKFDSKIGDAIIAAADFGNNIKSSVNQFVGDVAQEMENREIRKQSKQDMMAAIREKEERDISIKRAQLDSMRQAREALNQSRDVFENVPNLDVGRAMK